MRHSRRFLVETALTALSSVLAVITLIYPTWIEALLHVDPDQYSGSLEWMIALVFAVIALACLVAAGFEWQRLQRVQKG